MGLHASSTVIGGRNSTFFRYCTKPGGSSHLQHPRRTDPEKLKSWYGRTHSVLGRQSTPPPSKPALSPMYKTPLQQGLSRLWSGPNRPCTTTPASHPLFTRVRRTWGWFCEGCSKFNTSIKFECISVWKGSGYLPSISEYTKCTVWQQQQQRRLKCRNA